MQISKLALPKNLACAVIQKRKDHDAVVVDVSNDLLSSDIENEPIQCGKDSSSQNSSMSQVESIKNKEHVASNVGAIVGKKRG